MRPYSPVLLSSASRCPPRVFYFTCVCVLLGLYVCNAHMFALGRVYVCVRRCVCVVKVAWATSHTECVLQKQMSDFVKILSHVTVIASEWVTKNKIMENNLNNDLKK